MASLVLGILIALCLFASVGDRSVVSWNQVYRAAEARLNSGEFEGAAAAARRGWDFWRGYPASPWHWRFRLALAEAVMELNRVDEAVSLLDRPGGNSEFEARRQAGLAIADYRLRRYGQCRRRLDFVAALHPGPQVAARVELVRGMLHLNAGRLSEAEECFRSVLRRGSPGSLAETYALNNLGFLDLRRFRYGDAVAWFERARRLADRTGSARARHLALGNLGYCYSWIGDLDRSLELFSSAAALAVQSGDTAYAQKWLVGAAEVNQALGHYPVALRDLREARALARPSVDDRSLLNTLNDLSDFALETHDLPAASRYVAEARSVAGRLGGTGDLAWPRLNAARIDAAGGHFARAESQFHQALSAAGEAADPTALWASHHGLAALYRRAGRNAEAGREYRAAISVVERELSRLHQDQWQITFLSQRIRFYQDYVDFLVDRGETARALQVVESCRARVLSEKLGGSPPVAAAAVRLAAEARASRTVLMSYWLAPRRSFLWVVDSAGLHLFELPPQRRIAEAVARYTAAILRGRAASGPDRLAGEWLFRELVSAHYRVPPGSRVVISPDGSLHQLNFETLPSGPGGRYWIQDVTVAVAPSLALVKPPAPPAPPRLLLVGDPQFDGTGLPRLPALQAEVRSVAGHFRRKDVYTGAAATPEIWRTAAAGRYSVVHFAAHGLADRDDPLSSAIVLSPADGKYKLYARDIVARPLHADLVTLSACQTAGSRSYSGEGLTGFAWAFLSAGARNVVAGMWDVDDSATARMMGGFYNALSAGLPPAAALRRAKLALLASGAAWAKPVYWGSFTVFTRSLYPPVTTSFVR